VCIAASGSLGPDEITYIKYLIELTMNKWSTIFQRKIHNSPEETDHFPEGNDLLQRKLF